MEVLTITSESFENEVEKSNLPVLIDFYADWCGPCRMMAPIIEEIANESGGKYKVGKVNIDNNQDLALKYNIMSIPTIMIFNNGNSEKTFVGVRSKEEILEALK